MGLCMLRVVFFPWLHSLIERWPRHYGIFYITLVRTPLDV